MMRGLTKTLVLIQVALVSLPAPTLAQHTTDHIVSLKEVREAIRVRLAQREDNILKISQFLGGDVILLRAKGLVDLERIEQALPHLTDDELAELAARTERLANFRGAADTTIIYMGIVTLGVVLLLASGIFDGRTE